MIAPGKTVGGRYKIKSHIGTGGNGHSVFSIRFNSRKTCGSKKCYA